MNNITLRPKNLSFQAKVHRKIEKYGCEVITSHRYYGYCWQHPDQSVEEAIRVHLAAKQGFVLQEIEKASPTAEITYYGDNYSRGEVVSVTIENPELTLVQVVTKLINDDLNPVTPASDYFRTH